MARVPYASVVGSLMYAMVCTRPDISQAVSMVSRYMHNLGKNHWLAVKWILQYLYRTIDVGLLFKKDYGQQYIGIVILISLETLTSGNQHWATYSNWVEVQLAGG